MLLALIPWQCKSVCGVPVARAWRLIAVDELVLQMDFLIVEDIPVFSVLCCLFSVVVDTP